MSLISIIIPVYNVELYLRRCIDSILAQTFQDFELILVDDGSPDNCPKICDDYAAKDSRIRVIHQPNSGPSSARNAGLDLARGKYILFCDSDDYVSKTYIQNFLPFISNTQDNFIFSGFNVVSNNRASLDNRMLRCKSIEYAISDFFDLQRQARVGYAWNVLYYAEVIQKESIRFPTNVIVEDLPFNLNYLRYMDRMTCTGRADYFYVQYDRETLSKKFYIDGFRRWKEKYEVSLAFIRDVIPANHQDREIHRLATFYLYFFLCSLNNTFDSRNKASLYKKLKYNSSVVCSDMFQHCLAYADNSRENPVLISLLSGKHYYSAYLYQLLSKLKSCAKKKEKKK